MKLITPERSSSLPRGLFLIGALLISLVVVAVLGLTIKAAFITAFALGVAVMLDLGLFLDSLNGPRFEVDTRARTFRRVCNDHTSTFLGSAPGVCLCLSIHKKELGGTEREIWTLADGRRKESFMAPEKEKDRYSVLRLLRRVDAVIVDEDER